MNHFRPFHFLDKKISSSLTLLVIDFVSWQENSILGTFSDRLHLSRRKNILCIFPNV